MDIFKNTEEHIVWQDERIGVVPERCAGESGFPRDSFAMCTYNGRSSPSAISYATDHHAQERSQACMVLAAMLFSAGNAEHTARTQVYPTGHRSPEDGRCPGRASSARLARTGMLWGKSQGAWDGLLKTGEQVGIQRHLTDFWPPERQRASDQYRESLLVVARGHPEEVLSEHERPIHTQRSWIPPGNDERIAPRCCDPRTPCGGKRERIRAGDPSSPRVRAVSVCTSAHALHGGVSDVPLRRSESVVPASDVSPCSAAVRERSKAPHAPFVILPVPWPLPTSSRSERSVPAF
jgi:hypothetical protein